MVDRHVLDELSGAAEGARVVGDGSTVITGLVHDSRSVRPGDLFVCLVGGAADGHAFAARAVEAGARAVVVQEGREQDMPAGVPAIVVPNTRVALAALSAAFYGHPSAGMVLVGVTGTNGKTTTVHMLAAILRAHGLSTGIIGTLGAEIDGVALESERTTPEADRLQSLFAGMAARGARAAVMEVSSHALAQYRTDRCAWDAGVFTNLTQDHLDYHETMEAYLEAKLRLFRDYPAQSDKPFVAAINVDDPHGDAVARATVGRVLTFGSGPGTDVGARDVEVTPTVLRYTLVAEGVSAPVRLNLGGAFQVANSLGAAAACIGLGVPLPTVVAGLAALKSVPGRFEAVPTGRGFSVVVDYAHTPDGLENLLRSARRLEPARVVVVFGCGGDRDPTKRPIMGRIAGEHADIAIVTSDNPRTEEPDRIIADIVPGLEGASARVIVEPDRRAAIAIGMSEARDGDIVLIAGKGHEDYQEVNGVKHPFDDRQVVREILQRGEL